MISFYDLDVGESFTDEDGEVWVKISDDRAQADSAPRLQKNFNAADRVKRTVI